MIHLAHPASEPAMSARRPLPRDQLMFTAVLILLTLFAVLLWFKDPAHRYSGKSRVDWPPVAPAKP
jgi:hypothetical protein